MVLGAMWFSDPDSPVMYKKELHIAEADCQAC